MFKNRMLKTLEKVSELTTKVADGTLFVIRKATYDRERKCFEIVPEKKDVIILADENGIKNIEIAYNAAVSAGYRSDVFSDFSEIEKYDLTDKRIAEIMKFAV